MKTLDTWTPRDEQLLAELIERKERVRIARINPLVEFVGDNMPHIRHTSADGIVEWMIENADKLRDLLGPFDSGVRFQKDSLEK